MADRTITLFLPTSLANFEGNATAIAARFDWPIVALKQPLKAVI